MITLRLCIVVATDCSEKPVCNWCRSCLCSSCKAGFTKWLWYSSIAVFRLSVVILGGPGNPRHSAG